MTEKHVRKAIRSELNPETARNVIKSDLDGQFGVIGIDCDGRIVLYTEDGMVMRQPNGKGSELDPFTDWESVFRGFKPHSSEGAVLKLETDDWTWVHPRYRWVTEHPAITNDNLEIEGDQNVR